MKTYEEINSRIESGHAVVLNAEEVISYVDENGIDKAAQEIDVVTTATFGPMCSSGCFINFGQCVPKIRITEAWLDDVLIYSGLAAVDGYLGATQLRHNDPANMYYPGEFRFGGGHVMEKLVSREKVQLFALSYGTDEYPKKEIRTYLTIDDLNQIIMTNPRNCYQNYNAAINTSSRSIYTYLGHLKPHMQNLTYCSAGQLSPLLNDPLYETIGIGSKVWLAGAHGHVYAEGTQHSPSCDRTEDGYPRDGAGTLALTADMKKMDPEFVRGVSLRGYGVSLALGIGIPIPILNADILKKTTVRDRDLYAPVVDYSRDYPQATGKVMGHLSYEELKSGEVIIDRKKVKTTSLSSYSKAKQITDRLKEEIQSGRFTLSKPYARLPLEQTTKMMKISKD
ncbi:MAG: homocysteine biosynthesis protein [Spirochaetota bacterium]